MAGVVTNDHMISIKRLNESSDRRGCDPHKYPIHRPRARAELASKPGSAELKGRTKEALHRAGSSTEGSTDCLLVGQIRIDVLPCRRQAIKVRFGERGAWLH
jgi:hypothetical protein